MQRMSTTALSGFLLLSSANLMANICGPTTDWQGVEQYDGQLGPTVAFVAQHQSAVGQIKWDDDLAERFISPGTVNGQRWCSGTLISRDLFLTAGHCFDTPAFNSDVKFPLSATGPLNGFAAAQDAMHVTFNYQQDEQGQLRQERQYDIVELLEYRHGGVDYAVLRLAGNPGDFHNYAHLSTQLPYVGQPITVIQHPNRQVKVVESGYYSHKDGQYIWYKDLDTEQGSSGSGVLNDVGELIGVHARSNCSAIVNTGENGAIALNRIVPYSSAVAALVNPQQLRPDADFSYEFHDLAVRFSDLSEDKDGYITQWQWDFGDLNTSMETVPVHLYAAAGQYQVSLTVTDNLGATHIKSDYITVLGSASDCSAIAPWSASQGYFVDAQVKQGQLLYKAKWWSLNQNPAQHSHQHGDAWSIVGSCM